MFKKAVLGNGLRILTAPMRGTNTVSVFVMCGTGSDYETKEQNGISHFLEHMFFKGTATRPSAEIIRHELDRMGSISNAFTDHETTGYYIKAGAIYFDQALEILADIYKRSLLNPEEVEREKQVVIEEMNLRRDEPTSYIWRLWEKVLYGDQPAGWEIAGEEKNVRALTRESLLEYFHHQYVAENTAVVVAGNIDEVKATARITELFSDIRHAPPRPRPPVAIEQSGPKILGEERKIDQTNIVVGFRGYDAYHPKRYTADMLATILGGNWSSRMFSRIRERLGLAYTVYTASDTASNRGCLVTYAGVAHESAAKTVTAILEEYMRIREEAVPGEELARTKEFLKGRMLMALETSNAVAAFVSEEEMLTGKPLTPDEIFAIIDNVTPTDIQSAAQELFRKENLYLAALGASLDTVGLETTLDRF